MQSRNLAARAGRWSSTHRKTAIFGWLALVVLSLAIGGAVGTNNLKDEDQGTGQSRSAQQIVNDNFPKKGDENILIQTRSGSLNPSSPQIKSAVGDVVGAVSGFRTVSEVKSPLNPRNQGQISKDGRSALVTFSVRGRLRQGQAARRPDRDRHGQGGARRIRSCGSRSSATPAPSKSLEKAFSNDFSKAESPRSRSR